MPTVINGTTGVSQVQDGVVTPSKIPNNTIDSTKLTDGTITNADISTTAAITGTKIIPEFGNQLVYSDFGGRLGRPSNFWGGSYYDVDGHGSVHSRGNFEVSITCNGYRSGTPSANTTWTSLSGANGTAFGASQISLNPTGQILFATDANKLTGSTNNPTERMRIASDGNIGIGTTDTTKGTLTIQGGISTDITAELRILGSSGFIDFHNSLSVSSYNPIVAAGDKAIIFSDNPAGTGNLVIAPHSATIGGARITSGGNLLVGKNVSDIDTVGSMLEWNGAGRFSTAAATVPVAINRNGSGQLINFRVNGGGNQVGSISESGGIVSYNAFTGSHWGVLTDWSKLDIKVGTIMETINELIEYKIVVIDVIEDGKNTQKKVAYNGNNSVGTTATVIYKNQQYTGVVEKENNFSELYNKHTKVKVNNTLGSRAVYGVFNSWNTDHDHDESGYNDMYISALGNFVIRMAPGQTPQIGDLVEAGGNGCGVIQNDDIIRSKTVAKITSTLPQVVYEDGSFLVTCVLYCG